MFKWWLLGVILAFFSFGRPAMAQTAPAGERYYIQTQAADNPFGVWAPGVWSSFGNGNMAGYIFYGYNAGAGTPGAYSVNYQTHYGASFSRAYGNRHDVCKALSLVSYTDVITCYRDMSSFNMQRSLGTLPEGIKFSAMVSGVVRWHTLDSVNVISIAVSVASVNGGLWLREVYAGTFCGTRDIGGGSFCYNLGLTFYVGKLMTTTLPSGVDPENPDPPDDPGVGCRFADGSLPHGVMPFVSDEFLETMESPLPSNPDPDLPFPPEDYKRVFKFGNGYGPDVDKDCVYAMGPRPGANYLLGTGFCAPGEPCLSMSGAERAVYFNGDSNGCYEVRNVVKDFFFRLQGGDNWNSRTCLYWALGKTMAAAEIERLEKNAINVTLEPSSPADMMGSLTPGEDLIDQTTPMQQVLDELGNLAVEQGSPQPLMQELEARTEGAVTIKKEPEPCTIQSYFHPFNYYSDGSCLGAFDDAWGAVAFDPDMAAVWGATPKSADATLDQLSSLDWPLFDGPVCWVGIAGGGDYSNCVRVVKPITRIGKPGAPPVKLPPGSSIPEDTPGTVGGGGTGSDPEAPENPEEELPGTGEGFYDSKYPNGVQGVWDAFTAQVADTPIMQSLDGYKVEGDATNGGWCFAMPRLVPGDVVSEQFCIKDEWLDFIATVLLIASCISAVRIVTGW